MAKMKSNKLITNFPVPLSEEENQNLNLTLSGVLTGKGIWRPAVNASGDISWTYDEENSRDVPTPMNIRGPEGKAPFLRVNSANSHLEWSRDRISWEDTKQTTSGAVGPAGKDGVDGQNGTNGTDGVTPVVSVESFSHNPTDPEGTNGGTRISFYYGPDDEKNKTYSAFNGAPGQGGGGGSYLEGKGIVFTENNTTINAKINGPDIRFDGTDSISFNTDGVDAGGFYNMIEGHETWASGAANHVEGMWTWAKGQGNHAQNVGCSAIGYGVNAQGLWTCFISDSGDGGDKWWNHGAGASVEGICNRTRETTYSGEGATRGPVHGGILKVIGNGHRLHPDIREDASYVLSDAFIFYRDGTMWTSGSLEIGGRIHGVSDLAESATYAEKFWNEYEEVPQYRGIGDKFKSAFDSLQGLQNTKLDQDVWDDYSGSFVPMPSADRQYLGYFLNSVTHTSGWVNLGDNFFSKTESDGRYIQKGAGALSLNIGNNNTVQNDGKCVAIGNGCNVSGNSCAVNDGNVSWDNSFAFGWTSSAALYSLAGGNKVRAYDHSVAIGYGGYNNEDGKCIASNYSVAMGDACEAYNYSQSFGRGVKFTGESTAHGRGALAIGGWNKTQSNALFVVGNGTGNGNSRSDAMVVGLDGGVSATRFANKSGYDNVGSYQGINNVQVYPAGTSTSNLPDDGVLRIFLEN